MIPPSGLERGLPAFFAVAACSWMPHWSCHYYRLETGTTFVVGSWEFSPVVSVAHLLLYTGLIGLSVTAVVVPGVRSLSALLSGLLHLAIGAVHVARLVHPFRFEVIGWPWPLGASLREVSLVIGFGLACLAVAWRTRRAA